MINIQPSTFTEDLLYLLYLAGDGIDPPITDVEDAYIALHALRRGHEGSWLARPYMLCP